MALPSWAEENAFEPGKDPILDSPAGSAQEPSVPTENTSADPLLEPPADSSLEKPPPSSDEIIDHANEMRDKAQSIEIREYQERDPWYNGLSFEIAMINSGNLRKSGGYFTGGGARYELTLLRRIFFSQHTQDSIGFEAGAFYYQLINYQEEGDSYSVFPLVVTMPYTLRFDETYGMYFYGGIMNPIVVSSTGSNDAAKMLLSTQSLAAGLGLIFVFGPQWEFKINAGIDMLSTGFVLRF